MPGDQLRLEVFGHRIKSNSACVSGLAKVGDALAAEAKLRFVMVDADRAAGSLDRDDATVAGHARPDEHDRREDRSLLRLFLGREEHSLMATLIADTACIDPRAEIADDVEVGPYCVIGPDVKIGRGTRLIAHVCIHGLTTLGEDNVVHPFAVIGGEPQDVSFRGSPTRVEIGDQNVIREGVTIHRGSEKEQGRHPDRLEQPADGQRPRRARLRASTTGSSSPTTRSWAVTVMSSRT